MAFSPKLLQQGASGASAGTKNYIEDVFSTFVYTGNGSSQSIENAIELDGNVQTSLVGKTITNLGGAFDAGFTMASIKDGIVEVTNGFNLGYVPNTSGYFDVYVDMGAATVVTGYLIAPQGTKNEASFNTPTSFIVKASNDASSWTTIQTFSSIPTSYPAWNPGSYTPFVFSNSTGYRYWRFQNTTYGSGAAGVAISEWNLLVNTPSVGKGGLVWLKRRTGGTGYHVLTDTVRGAGLNISTNDSIIQYNDGQPTFKNNGFNVINNNPDYNAAASTYVSWTFRKQAKFFDIITWTGTGGTGDRSITHNLAAVPAAFTIKPLSFADNWQFRHKDLPADTVLFLNLTSAATSAGNRYSSTPNTATTFYVNAAGAYNILGETYVAYLFAHNAGGFGLTGNDNVISCGSFTTPSSGDATITLGYEPQWLLVKRTDGGANDWYMVDTMRGLSQTSQSRLDANLAAAEETTASPWFIPTATGFTAASGSIGGSRTFIYIAIRRGPMKVPTVGTSVFNPEIYTGDNSNTRVINTGFPPDMVWTGTRNERRVGDRLRGLFTNPGPINTTYSSSDEQLSSYSFPQMSAWQTGNGTVRFENSTGINYVLHAFRRAPSFFDIVCYTGTGSQQNITHNLGVAPELIFVKSRSAANGGLAYNKTITASKYLKLFFTGEGDYAAVNDTGGFAGVEPTSSVFTVGTYNNVNGNGSTYVAYLFSTCAGVSKVGSYTGTATTLQVDCGFTTGARFVLIKRTDSTGGWYFWDTARGIIAGNDPYLLLNSSASEVTNTDYIDTYSPGFELSSTAPAAINANGGTYIFLAIA